MCFGHLVPAQTAFLSCFFSPSSELKMPIAFDLLSCGLAVWMLCRFFQLSFQLVSTFFEPRLAAPNKRTAGEI